MQVSIVILNYNGRNYLEKFLPSVIEYSGNHQIIIADNCSTDDSVQFLKENYPSIRVIHNSRNGGYSWGYNEALKQIDSEYYVLLNSDVEVTRGWIDPIMDLMAHDSSIGAIQPKILSFNQKNKFEYAGAAGGYIDKYGFPFCKGRIFQELEIDNGQFNGNYEIFWASGACLFLRSEVFHELGGFDNDFFAHMEEIDLCWRMHNANNKVMYCGMSSVYHVGGGTLHKSNPKKTYLNFRNGLSLLLKNYSQSDLFLKLPVRLLFDFLAALKFIFTDSFHDGVAVLKAHLHFWWIFPKNLQKRKKMGLKKKKSIQIPEIYNNSIVIDHFFKKIRSYNDLRS